MGDVILFTPHLQQLRKLFPSANLDILLLPNGSREFLQSLGCCNNFWLFKDHRYLPVQGSWFSLFKESLRILWHIRGEQYDLAIWPYARTTLRKQVFAWGMGARLSVLHEAKTWLRNFLPKSIHLVPFQWEEQVVARNTNLLKACSIPTEELEVSLQIPEEAVEWAKDYLASINPGKKPIFGFHAGGNTRWTTARQWKPQRFSNLADRLVKRFNALPIFFGISSEHALLESIVANMKTGGVILDAISPIQTAAVISQLQLFIGNESALVHMSGLQNVLTVSLVGPTQYQQTAPMGKRAHVIRLALSCSPCFETGFSSHCSHQACMRDLTVDLVYQEVIGILGRFCEKVDCKAEVHHLPYRESESSSWKQFLLERKKWTIPQLS